MRQAARRACYAARNASTTIFPQQVLYSCAGLASRATENAVDLACTSGRTFADIQLTSLATPSLLSCSRGFSTAAVVQRGKQQGGKTGGGNNAALFFMLPCAFTAFLGTWQLQRRHWKANLLHERENALKADGLQLNELPPAPKEFTRVQIQGHFDHASALYVGPRPRSSMGSATNGYQLITPVHSEQWKKTILVNRGWVPATWRSDPQIRQPWDTDQEVELEAVIRESEDPSSFVPQNVPATGEWFWIDVSRMASALGLPPDTPLAEAVSIETGGPSKDGTPSTMDVLALRTARPAQPQEALPSTRSISELMNFKVTPADHRNYALTWYTLSGATAAMAWGIVRRRGARL